ncbi:MAG: metal ABC transporter substrate-binding protein [Synergistaceae bacterium]|jgi:D-methionine transport system substrate-binding protein|nr:metal ABC transporter substrate-binding protein [Synergistaceae bacterium]
MKSRNTAALLVLSALFSLGSLGGALAAEGVTLKVIASAVPHAELLEFVKPKLAEKGVDLVITVIDESSASSRLYNEQTHNGEFDVNFAQHLPYLESVKAEQDYDLASAGGIHVEPIGFYSTKYKTKAEIPTGRKITVAVPNNATNEYRAFRVLEQNGFIKLKPDIQNFSATKQDIADFGQVEIVELDAGIIIRNTDQLDGYITNTNRILEAGIDPTTVLFREGKDSPYANILVTQTKRVNDPAIAALRDALRTEDVRRFIEEKYKGAVVPAF